MKPTKNVWNHHLARTVFQKSYCILLKILLFFQWGFANQACSAVKGSMSNLTVNQKSCSPTKTAMGSTKDYQIIRPLFFNLSILLDVIMCKIQKSYHNVRLSFCTTPKFITQNFPVIVSFVQFMNVYLSFTSASWYSTWLVLKPHHS